ncbi:DUF4040 domain-containing protein [Oceanibacterium hippocampi]|uniref:Na(+)/H(+) antiporter subunit A n=1 Tax=Oceanibacterium hippocampi TaxID=745714 RepID=A0A1Y5U2B7_9PROT|nr:DUF4040 domain-containing protein [Oceanibacterium hippocampi]SLN76940.1 Na(+)/H(+) antiporter subunit A [Oceanibacterium hippocampi]
MSALIGPILLAFLIAVALAILNLRNLFAVVMLSGIFSFLMAGVFVILDAVDVAFTEAAVGAGISTVLMLGTLALTAAREKLPRKRLPILPLLVVLAVGGVLIYGTFDMPAIGDPNAPVHQHMAPRFIEQGPIETGVPNMVTSVLASYRGYDTMGETAVIFTAAIGVLLMIGRRRKRKPETATGKREGRDDAV